MRQVAKALGLMTLGGLLVWMASWFHAYLYPEVIYPREDQIARVLLRYAYVENRGTSSTWGQEKPVVAVCVVRTPRRPGDREDRELVRTISYFRALARPWDPRGWLLDRRWPISAVRRYANGVVFSVNALRGALEWGFNERRERRLFPKDTSLEFYSDCASVANREKGVVVKLVAVGPAIRNPYRRYKDTRSAFGFFVAIERVYPGGRSERFVRYCQSYVLSHRLAKKSDYWRIFDQSIPEKYWKRDFDGWESISGAAMKDEWWGEMVFPPPSK